jgi:uncharacterized sulfatase
VATKQTPNILLITTDQQRFDQLGIKGVKGIKTPHLDRLGREGVHFDRAYCPSPICTPTRVSLLTGQYPSQHQAYSIGVTADPFPRPTIADLLSSAGYATALFGKTHFVRREDEASHMAGIPNPSPEFFKTWKGPYLGFEEFQGSTGHTINKMPAMHYRTFLEESGEDYQQWFPYFGDSYDHHRCGLWEIPEQYHDTSWVAGLTTDYIERNSGEKPWFCWASFEDPHEPLVCPDPWYSSVDTDEMELYEGYREGEFDDRPDLYRMCREKDFDPLNDRSVQEDILGGAVHEKCSIPSVFGEPLKDERVREATQATLGMVAFLDDRVGAILKKLEETGQLDNTIIIYTSDHGEMHGHHGLWGKGVTAYEDCQRVPLLVWGPGHVESRGTVSGLANLVDLPKTILNLSGVSLPQGIQGTDLTPILNGTVDSVQDATLVELRASQTTVNQHTLITDRYKLVVYKNLSEGELYDLETDPDQYTNLWSNPSFTELKLGLLHRLTRFHMQKEPHGQPRVSFA